MATSAKRKSMPRITARTDEATQERLAKAAMLAGMPSVNAFVLSAAVEKANEVIEREQIIHLSQRDAMAMIEALEEPKKPNARLQKAAERYKQSVKK